MAEYIEWEATLNLLRNLGSRDYRREEGTIADAMKMIMHPHYTPPPMWLNGKNIKMVSNGIMIVRFAMTDTQQKEKIIRRRIIAKTAVQRWMERMVRMKRNQTRRYTIKCPFYNKEERQIIYCKGLLTNTSLHLAFGNMQDCFDYKKQVCTLNYQRCRIFKMLEENYGE